MATREEALEKALRKLERAAPSSYWTLIRALEERADPPSMIRAANAEYVEALGAARAALALPPDPAPGPDRYAEGWRAGVLAARDYLRRVWDDGDQGNANEAAELELLRLFARDGIPESAPAPAGAVMRGPRCPICGREMFTGRRGDLLHVDPFTPCAPAPAATGEEENRP